MGTRVQPLPAADLAASRPPGRPAGTAHSARTPPAGKPPPGRTAQPVRCADPGTAAPAAPAGPPSPGCGATGRTDGVLGLAVPGQVGQAGTTMCRCVFPSLAAVPSERNPSLSAEPPVPRWGPGMKVAAEPAPGGERRGGLEVCEGDSRRGPRARRGPAVCGHVRGADRDELPVVPRRAGDQSARHVDADGRAVVAGAAAHRVRRDARPGRRRSVSASAAGALRRAGRRPGEQAPYCWPPSPHWACWPSPWGF